MPYQPIENYGLIGNMHTAALVGRNGSIDWLCLPHFDSPSVFGAVLDDRKGGHFRIAPAAAPEAARCQQIYWPDTNVLVTRFLLAEAVVEVTDYMPVGVRKGECGFRQLVRRVEAVRGSVPVLVECFPAFNYARAQQYNAYGYPAAKPFNGRRLWKCDSALYMNDTGRTLPTMGIQCNMTGGSSGGGWVAGGAVASVNSYTYGGLKNTMFGPYQGAVAQSLYQTAD